jgi:hypothetical protein
VERQGGIIKMNQIVMDVIVQITAYITILLIAIFFINWTTNGFVFPSIRCKLSRGRLTLVFVKTISGAYYKVGSIEDGMLLYKDNSKNKKHLTVPSAEYITHIGGTKAIIIDGDKNSVLKADFSSAKGFDAVKYENLYIRALTSPQLQDANLKIILLAAIVAAACAAGALWFVWLQGQQITQLLELVQNLGAGL